MRMLSENMKNRERWVIESRIRRRLCSLALVLLTALTLTACAEGTARDAEIGKEQDAKRTSVVNEIQATESAGFLILGTPSPEPTK